MHDLATVCMAIESRHLPNQTNNTPILLQQRRVFSRALHSGLIFLPIKTSEVKYKSEYDGQSPIRAEVVGAGN